MTPEWVQWLAMAVLALVAAAVMTRPWWQRDRAGVPGRGAANVAAYRSRIDELAAEREAGLLDAEDAGSLEQELGARLLADARDAPSAGIRAAPQTRGRGLAIALATVLLIAFAASWYGLGGSWRTQRDIAGGASGAEPPAPVDPQIAAMVEQLARKLETDPDNLEGWALLGRSYFATQRYAEAARAYGEANQRLEASGRPASPEWLVGQGEAIAFADGRQIPPPAAALFERAVALAPDYGKALWYSGLAAAQGGRLPLARERWTALLATPDLPEPMRTALQERLRVLDGATADAAGTATPAAAAAPVSLRVQVSLNPVLATKAPKDATLFVFAKAASGPPMPLAVQRLPGAALPRQVVLDDSMAMAPQLKLSQFDRYVVTARLSASGGAQPQHGDLQGSVTVDRAAAAQAIELNIDTVLP